MANRRDAIMSAVKARMEAILTANGYYSELGLNVIDWRPRIGDTTGGYVVTEQGELPAIHLRDPSVQTRQANVRGDESNLLSVELEIAHESGASGQTMRQQIADVRKAIGVDPKWGGLATRTIQDMTTETVRVQADYSFFRTIIRATIEYTTSAFAEE